MKRKICLWIGLILFSLFVVQPARAQSANRFTLTAAGQNLTPGQSLIVSLQADISTPSQGFSVQLGYDPACLELISTTPTGLLTADSFPVDKSAAGLIDVAYTLLGGEKTLSGSGVLLEIAFKALKACQTNLQLTSAQLVAFDDQGKARYIDVQPGEPLAIAFSPQAELPILPPPVADQTSSQDSAGSSMPTTQPDSPSPAMQKSLQVNLLPILRAAATPLLLGGLIILASITLLIVGFRLKKAQPKTHRAAYSGGSPTIYEEQPLFSGSYLLIEWGAQLTKYTLHTSPFNIGRELGSHLTLSNPLVSRMHAQLIQIGADWYISDNHSRNGTYVNGQLVQYPQRLYPGDQIRLGRQVGLHFR